MRDLYMDVMIKRPEIIHDLHARLIHAVHQVQTDDAGLAVSFPDWRNLPGEFGLLFRVFASEQQLLDAFAAHIDKLIQLDLVRLFPALPVPATDKSVCFSRDQAINKSGPAAARRRERRGAPAVEPKAAPIQTHWLNLRSSSGNTFRLVIRKSTSAQEGGHRYGLGLMVPDF